MVALKDLAKEGIVAGYLLGKSLGGGGGEVTEVNTKLAGTWTSPPITGATVGTIFEIDLNEVFQNAIGFNANIEQTIRLFMHIGFISETADYDVGDINWVRMNYQITWGTDLITVSVPHLIGENLRVDKYSYGTAGFLHYSPNGNTLSTNMAVKIRQVTMSHPERMGYFSLVFEFNYPEIIVR